MTASDTIDQHFKVRQLEGKWYARAEGMRFLCPDGMVRDVGLVYMDDALFETYADLEAAYELWLQREKQQ